MDYSNGSLERGQEGQSQRGDKDMEDGVSFFKGGGSGDTQAASRK